MKKIKCLLIDDEPPAVELLKKYASMIEQLEVVGTSHNALKAFDMLKDKEVDLIFLDIQMPILSGIDFVKTLKDPPAVIFTTAHREYALEGYELDVVDYLLKPIAFDRFLKAVDKYRNRITTLSSTSNFSKEAPKDDFIFFNVNKTNHKVFFKDILFVESLKDYVRIHTTEKKLVVKGNLSTCMKQLSDEQFIRIHRSYAIALQHIQSYNQSEVTIHTISLPVGMSYRDAFLKRIQK